MKALPYILAGAYAVGISYFGAHYFGDAWRIKLLIALVIPLLILSVIVPWLERRVYRGIDKADPTAIQKLRSVEPDFDAFMLDRPRTNEKTDFSWLLTDVALFVALAFYSPLLYTVFRYRGLTRDIPFDGWAMTLMLLGASAWAWLRRIRIKKYECPRCGARPIRLEGRSVRYSCAKCATVWLLGDPMFEGGDNSRAA